MDAATSGPDISEEEHEVVLNEERAVVDKDVQPVEGVRVGKETVTGTRPSLTRSARSRSKQPATSTTAVRR